MKLSKEEKTERENWKIEEAVRTLQEYQRIMKDKELKEKAIKKLKEKSKEFKELANELD